MIKKITAIYTCFFMITIRSAVAETNIILQPCPKDNSKLWDNCVGTRHYPNGDIYSGEFKNGKRDGNGKYVFSNGDVYEGIFSEGKRDGKGIAILISGEKYVGSYKNDIREGKGELNLTNGVKFEGEFSENKFNGSGVIQSPNGEKYAGNFIRGEASGNGTYTFSNKRKYVGNFEKNIRTGEGILYDEAGHALIKGDWKNGRYNSPDPGIVRIPLEESGGDLWRVTVSFNEATNLQFKAILDSGATDISIPEEIVITLFRAGQIQSSDFIGNAEVTLADGSKIKSNTFNIRKLNVGGAEVRDVTAGVTLINKINPSESILIGQSFLRQFKSWKIDNSSGALILTK